MRISNEVGVSTIRIQNSKSDETCRIGGGHEGYSFEDGANFCDKLYHFISISSGNPMLPLIDVRSSLVPILLPVNHGAGGGEVQYDILPGNIISIKYLSEYDASSLMIEGQSFPKCFGLLCKVPYHKLSIAYSFMLINGYEVSPEEQNAGRELLSGPLIGSSIYNRRGSIIFHCRNDQCSYFKKPGRLNLFLSIPVNSFRESNFDWGEYSGAMGLNFYAGLCEMCGSIFICNAYE
jgi:hypothetical protein